MMRMIFLAGALLLAACSNEASLTRVDVQLASQYDTYEDVKKIMDPEALESLEKVIQEVEWDNTITVDMARQPDVKAVLFYQEEKEMPERLVRFDVWFNEEAGTATIVSDKENQGYGKADQEQAEVLRELLLE